MAKVLQFSEITPGLAFTEFDFYKDYEESFKKSELGRFHALLPLREMAIRFGLIDSVPRRKVGRKSYFSPEGKVALMFLKSYTGLSAPKLMEQLNANIHYQIFCGIRISSANPLTNYKLIDDIILELSKRLKIQAQQESLAETWKPYMRNLDTIYTDATCYESSMRYPTDAKLLWECVEKVYTMMCEASKELGIHRMRTKYLDVAHDNMAYVNPIVLTRSLDKAKQWLKSHARGSERYGLLASSKAERLKAISINVRYQPDFVHWFLEDDSDIRSSNALEDTLTEFKVQGLEIDWACVAWDADLRLNADHTKWQHFQLRSGKKWQNINKQINREYQINAYRVLLTRARQGMILIVPNGDNGVPPDETRKPEWYDGIYN